MESEKANIIVFLTNFLMTFLRDNGAFGVIALILILAALIFGLYRLIFKKSPRRSAKTVEASHEAIRQAEIQTEQPEAAAPEPTNAYVEEVISTNHNIWLNKLKQGLSKTRESFYANLKRAFGDTATISDDLLEQLHEVLYKADIGTATTDQLIAQLKEHLSSHSENVAWSSAKDTLKSIIADMFAPCCVPTKLFENQPTIILVAGVNGTGKTTTIGKLAAHFRAQNKTVLLCAADTFRAAAIDQLQVWADRLQVDMIRHQPGSDPAAVAYDAVKAAISRKVDVLLIDTAGRLHNKTELMDELQKIRRVISKDLPSAPHETWLVIDATTGQNAVMQIKSFKECIPITGLIVTKLDGTAKGGIIIGACDQFKIPIRYIGVGEKASDLHEFSAQDYLNSLFDDTP